MVDLLHRVTIEICPGDPQVPLIDSDVSETERARLAERVLRVKVGRTAL